VNSTQGWFSYDHVLTAPGPLTVLFTVAGHQSGSTTTLYAADSVAGGTPVTSGNAVAQVVLFNPLRNPCVQYTVKLSNVSATAQGFSIAADLAAVAAAQGRLTSPEWAEVVMPSTLPVTANITVSALLMTAVLFMLDDISG
jgi:hypothetical protein